MMDRSEWSEWASGDYVHAPDRAGAEVAQAEVLRRVAVGFRRVIIDWPEGERWAEARAAKAAEDGYRGLLLEAERALRDSRCWCRSPTRPAPTPSGCGST